MSLRREPFRLFFPLGLLLGSVGVVPWVLFTMGRLHAWPAELHGLVMTQGFLGALAVGFLGTMLPRRAGIAPMTSIELALASLGLLALAAGLLVGSLLLAEVAFVAVVVVLLRYVVFALRRGVSPRPVPPSFVFLPLGVATGVAGALLLALSTLITSPGLYALGRGFAQQGLLLLVILAIAPMLAPVMAAGEPAADLPPAAARRWRIVHLVAGALIVGSFALELWGSVRLGLALRALVVGAELAAGARPWRLGSRAGLHRGLFRLAVVLIPLGLAGAALAPAARASLLHLSFIGGFALLALSVSVHVTVMHTGNEGLADRTTWPVAVAGALTLAAAAVRSHAERFGERYVEALFLAAVLWLAASLVWALFVIPMLVRRAAPSPGATR